MVDPHRTDGSMLDDIDGNVLDYTDGNMLAGPMRELFAVDLTAATGRCANCGLTNPLAQLRVYQHAPGLVARCPGCEEVVMRLVRTPTSAWLDLRGAVFVQVPMPPELPASW